MIVALLIVVTVEMMTEIILYEFKSKVGRGFITLPHFTIHLLILIPALGQLLFV